MVTRDRSLIQAVELWFPQGEFLGFAAGAYRGRHQLAATSPSLRFHYGEGLPGGVWATGRAALRTDLNVDFVRAELAADAGIDAALGCPLFDGDRLVAVMTLLLSHRSQSPNCVEVWDVVEDPDVMKHGSGYYVGCAELETFSPFIQFARGSGLPGLTWLRGGVEVMEDVQRANAFVRAGLASRCGLRSGLGMPIYRGRKVAQVLALFGGDEQPLVQGVELYRPHGTELGAAMRFDWSAGSSRRPQSWADAPGRAQALGVLASLVPSVSETKTPQGPEISLAVPIHDRKGLREIVVLRL